MHVVRGGDFSAAVELRRQFPGITDNVQAREGQDHCQLETAAGEATPGHSYRAGDY